jgi:ADP-ribose pyrophosphatase YjhB (NUDIX family)
VQPHPLSQTEFEDIYSKVPRLTVEVVVASERGVLLSLRTSGPCRGLWHIPGGTVYYGEPLTEAVRRVAKDELCLDVRAERLLGYLEYPSHLAQGIDWPVGIAFGVELTQSSAQRLRTHPETLDWFTRLPEAMHYEQRNFLSAQNLAS